MDRMYGYWGKAAREGEAGPKKHLLVYHLLDVAAVGTVLLDRHPTLLRRLATMIALDEESTRRWVLWLLGHHDIGKFAAAFQRLRPDLFPKTLSDRYRYTQRHDTLAYALWKQKLFDKIFPAVESCSLVEDALLTLLRTSSGHHGKPPMELDWSSTWFRTEDVDAALSLSRQISRMFFAADHPPDIGVADERAFAGRVARASWAVAGLAVLSDWIGSNREWFPYRDRPVDLDEYWSEHAHPQAENAVSEAAVLPSPPQRELGFVHLFPKLTGATNLQDAADTVPIGNGPQLFIIEDLTGSGKTEAALTLAGRLLADGRADGMYVALPTTATADAMYRRVGDVYLRMFEPGSRPSLVLAHSRRDLTRDFRQSVGGEGIEAEAPYSPGEQGAAATCSAWLADNRKKALLAQVGVGTIDQALLAVLNVRHESLRALGLLGKILIVDEVHACDAYMNRLLEHLLELHAAQGGSAILLSATLPLSTRSCLVNAFCEGAESTPPEELPDAYPQLLSISHEGMRSVSTEPPAWSRRNLGFELIHDPDAASSWVAEKANEGACVCWIRNTVGDAMKAYDTLVERLGLDRVILFHARFAFGDRLAIEEDVLRRFGKDSTAKARSGKVVVATQVVEQSLDLDFDEMLSDLAPIDLLLQRAGRLHRHTRDRTGIRVTRGADPRGDPILRVLSPEPVDDPGAHWIRSFLPGTAAVYPHHGHLWRTARFLARSGWLSLPDDLREAIETVFSESSRLPIPDGLENVSFRVEGQWMADASVAQLNGIALEEGYGGAGRNWTDLEDTRTRLGEETVTLRLARWDGTCLEPWYEQRPKPWALSEISVRRGQVKTIEPSADPDLKQAITVIEQRDRLKESAKLLLPLVEHEDGTWRWNVLDGRGRQRTVRYRPDRGLEVER